MLITQNINNNLAGNVRNNPKTNLTKDTSFQPAEQQDLVEIGRNVDQQDRFIDLGPIVTIFGAGAGTIAGGVGGTIAYAFGAPGWVIPAAAVGAGILGGVIGHANEK